MPFTAKLILPLYAGILNLSAGLKDKSVCACKLVQVHEKIVIVTRITIVAIPATEILGLIVIKPQSAIIFQFFKSFKDKSDS